MLTSVFGFTGPPVASALPVGAVPERPRDQGIIRHKYRRHQLHCRLVNRFMKQVKCALGPGCFSAWRTLKGRT
jgi:hypothetical protein